MIIYAIQKIKEIKLSIKVNCKVRLSYFPDLHKILYGKLLIHNPFVKNNAKIFIIICLSCEFLD